MTLSLLITIISKEGYGNADNFDILWPYYRMYFAPGEHPPPHFHVYYNEYKASVNILTCEIMEGELPRKQARLALAWAELHQEELMADWQRVMNGEEPFKIQPLQ